MDMTITTFILLLALALVCGLAYRLAGRYASVENV